jgi:iron-sulfur cluster repair protein YtfE (RIC family)
MFEEFSTKAMYGENAVHVPMIMQEQGEIIVRPHLVMESERFVGNGLTGLATSSTDCMQPSYSKVLFESHYSSLFYRCCR